MLIRLDNGDWIDPETITEIVPLEAHDSLAGPGTVGARVVVHWATGPTRHCSLVWCEDGQSPGHLADTLSERIAEAKAGPPEEPD